MGLRFRRLLHLVAVVGAAVMLALPILLGPGTAGWLLAFGGAEEHHCACGMRKGECGCPECERLEAQDALDRERLREHPILRSSCGEGAPMHVSSALPAFAAPLVDALGAPGSSRSDPIAPAETLAARDPCPPPTPPPKLGRA